MQLRGCTQMGEAYTGRAALVGVRLLSGESLQLLHGLLRRWSWVVGIAVSRRMAIRSSDPRLVV